jgi:hypothetical protein
MNIPCSRKTCTVALAILIATVVTFRSATAQSPQPLPLVVMGPPDIENGRCWRELFEHPDQWAQTRAVINELLFPDHGLTNRNFTDAEMRAWFAQMQKWGLKLELETGAIKPWGVTGEGTFNRERFQWDHILSLGARLDSIAMDEPLCCVKFGLTPAKPLDYAVQETANFIALVRKNYPQTAIVEIEGYPSSPFQEHLWWIDALQKKLVEMHVRGLDGYRLDVDSVCYSLQGKGSWSEVARLQQFCHSRKLPFSLIYWAPGYNIAKALGTADDSTWYTGVIEQGYNYDQVTKAVQSGMAQKLKSDHFGRGDGGPDQYVIESYVGAPLRTIPDTDEYTFTRSVLDFTRKFVLGSHAVK